MKWEFNVFLFFAFCCCFILFVTEQNNFCGIFFPQKWWIMIIKHLRVVINGFCVGPSRADLL